MSDYIEWIRAGHLITVIFWMAGLLYFPRLLVYHSSAKLGGELDEALKIQERRLMRIIMNPSMILAFIFGVMLVGIRIEELSHFSWLHVKLAAVFVLFGYHGMLSKDRKAFERGERPRSEKFYRMFNEVPPILTILIVIMAVIEPF